MTALDLTVNGRPTRAEVEPRTHLADFLREQFLLTGTHLGCEHGVCGACTLLLNDAPVRGCLTLAALCNGARIHTIEGLHNDPVMAALREAFTAEHALQCGYCTSGMLITARDIVLRLPTASDDTIRLELAGNLCRCTGYNGIVKAIRRVLDNPPAIDRPQPAMLPTHAPIITPTTALEPASLPANAPTLSQSLRIALPSDTIWTAIQNPALVACCVPGARITAAEPGHITGEIQAGLGAIQARFAGKATLHFSPDTRTGQIRGEGQDSLSSTKLTAEIRFAVIEETSQTSQIHLDISYALRGPLAQFSRGPIVRVFAAELARSVARNLEAKLGGAQVKPVSIWRRIRQWLGW